MFAPLLEIAAELGVPDERPSRDNGSVGRGRRGELLRRTSSLSGGLSGDSTGMSARNDFKIVVAGIKALYARDLEAGRRLMHEDAEWRPSLTAGGDLERPVYRGPEGMLRYLDDLDAMLDNSRIEAVDYEGIGRGRLIVLGRVRGRAKESGIDLDVPFWVIWELRDGKLVRGTAFLRKEEALKEAGVLDE